MKLMLFALRTFSDTVTATEFAMTLTFDPEFATSYVTITFSGIEDVSISITFEFRRILSFNCSATAAAVLPNPTPIASCGGEWSSRQTHETSDQLQVLPCGDM